MVVGFAIVAAWELVSALGVVAFRRPIYNALSLVANMLGLAVLFLMLNAQFLFAAPSERLASVGIWINASSENAHILAPREPFLYLFHHAMDWNTDVFSRL